MNENNQNPYLLTLELAFIRWSVVCQRWDNLSAGHAPILQAFLAGWCCRCIGATKPVDVGALSNSFNAGWNEADDQIKIDIRKYS